jgi:hypothetical protein
MKTWHVVFSDDPCAEAVHEFQQGFSGGWARLSRLPITFGGRYALCTWILDRRAVVRTSPALTSGCEDGAD